MTLGHNVRIREALDVADRIASTEHDYDGLRDAITTAILQACERENELCAKTAEEYARDIKNDAIRQTFARVVCEKVAAAIRARI